MIDLIVLDIDGGAMLDECLASIRAQTVPCRVIVFDNGSRVPSRAGNVIRGEKKPWLPRGRKESRAARGVNEAFAQTAAPYVGVINNDVVLDRDWLEQVRDALDRDAQLAAEIRFT